MREKILKSLVRVCVVLCISKTAWASNPSEHCGLALSSDWPRNASTPLSPLVIRNNTVVLSFDDLIATRQKIEEAFMLGNLAQIEEQLISAWSHTKGLEAATRDAKKRLTKSTMEEVRIVDPEGEVFIFNQHVPTPFAIKEVRVSEGQSRQLFAQLDIVADSEGPNFEPYWIEWPVGTQQLSNDLVLKMFLGADMDKRGAELREASAIYHFALSILKETPTSENTSQRLSALHELITEQRTPPGNDGYTPFDPSKAREKFYKKLSSP
jgi:hypothetical protein